MKIGILTQPLYCNYGGLLQCYALQTVLKRMGHDAIVLQREFNREISYIDIFRYYITFVVKRLLGKRVSWHYTISQEQRDFIAQNTYKFIDTYINPRSKKCYTTEELKDEVNKLSLDAIIVGSDQVWRPNYSPCQLNYFLDFLDSNKKIKKISYAASFGTTEWLYTEHLEKECGELLKQFNAISVREYSAITLCKEHFGVNAVLTLDPTMLLNQDDYLKVTEERQQPRGKLFCYVLDKTPYKKNIIKRIVSETDYNSFESMPELADDAYNIYKDIKRCVYPPVEDWLSAFNEAEMVLTDSFHGTVFSIIFNKPFWVIGNEGRGMTRFATLLSLFDMKERLITTKNVNSVNFNTPIDWKRINSLKEKMQESSLQFIEQSLK